MRILEAKNWKKLALDRDEWAKLLKKVRAHQGLSSQCIIIIIIIMYMFRTREFIFRKTAVTSIGTV